MNGHHRPGRGASHHDILPVCDHDEDIGPHECPQLLNASSTLTKTRIQNKQHISTCCGLSIECLSSILFIFHLILLICGIFILVTCFYLTPETASTIRCLLPSTHANNIVFRSLVLTGILICMVSVVHLFAAFWNSRRNEKAKESDLKFTEVTPRRRSSTGQMNGNVRVSKTRKTPKQRTSYLLCFLIFSLLFLFTLQLTTSFIGFVCVTDFEAMSVTDQNHTRLIEHMFNLKHSGYSIPDILSIHREVFNEIESNLKCCGLYEYKDYGRESPVPTSCCRGPIVDESCGARKHPSNIYYDGCLKRIHNTARDELVLLSIVAIGFSFVEIFGLLFSCCLYVQLSTLGSTTKQEREV